MYSIPESKRDPVVIYKLYARVKAGRDEHQQRAILLSH